jgi:hypothetical protein
MTLSQFEALIARFGPVVDSWPADQIEPALDLLRASSQAQDLFAGAASGQPAERRPRPAASDLVERRAH